MKRNELLAPFKKSHLAAIAFDLFCNRTVLHLWPHFPFNDYSLVMPCDLDQSQRTNISTVKSIVSSIYLPLKDHIPRLFVVWEYCYSQQADIVDRCMPNLSHIWSCWWIPCISLVFPCGIWAQCKPLQLFSPVTMLLFWS